MNNDAELLRLCEKAAALEGPCPTCRGGGHHYNPHVDNFFSEVDYECVACHGTGRVPLLKGVRVACEHRLAIQRGWLVPRDCPECHGKGWTVAPADTVICAALEWWFGVKQQLPIITPLWSKPGWMAYEDGNDSWYANGDTWREALLAAFLAAAKGVKRG